ALSLSEVTVRGEGGVSAINDCTFAVRAGEIVGIAGVAGNGPRGLGNTPIGVRPAAPGTTPPFLHHAAPPSSVPRLPPGAAVFLRGEGLGEALVLSLTRAAPLMLGLHPVRSRRSRYSPQEALQLAAHAIAEYAIAAPSGRAPTAVLSGGNVQKVLVARAVLQA